MKSSQARHQHQPRHVRQQPLQVQAKASQAHYRPNEAVQRRPPRPPAPPPPPAELPILGRTGLGKHRAEVWRQTRCSFPENTHLALISHVVSNFPQETVRRVERNHYEYALQNNYASCMSTWSPPDLTPMYARYPMIDALHHGSATHNISGFMWVWWMDFDVFILNLSYPIHELLRGPRLEMVVSHSSRQDSCVEPPGRNTTAELLACFDTMLGNYEKENSPSQNRLRSRIADSSNSSHPAANFTGKKSNKLEVNLLCFNNGLFMLRRGKLADAVLFATYNLYSRGKMTSASFKSGWKDNIPDPFALNQAVAGYSRQLRRENITTSVVAYSPLTFDTFWPFYSPHGFLIHFASMPPGKFNYMQAFSDWNATAVRLYILERAWNHQLKTRLGSFKNLLDLELIRSQVEATGCQQCPPQSEEEALLPAITDVPEHTERLACAGSWFNKTRPVGGRWGTEPPQSVKAPHSNGQLALLNSTGFP